MFQLGAGQPRLDLRVATGAGLGEPPLPAAPGPPGAPQEQLAAAQRVGGGVDEAVAGGVERGDPAAVAVRDLVEVVGGVLAAQRVRAVGAAGLRYGDVAQGVLVPEVPGAVRRGEDAGVLVLGDGGVGPPVGGHRVQVRVADTDADEEEVGAVRKPEVHLEGQVAQPLPLPQAQHLAAVGRRYGRGVHRGAGQRGVSGGAGVPLDAAGEPGAVEGEVGGLQDGVAVEQFAAGGLVVQGVHAAAQARQDGGAQPVVLDDEGVEGRLGARTAVTVAHGYGQQRVQRCVTELTRHVGRQLQPLGQLDAVDVARRAEGGQRTGRADGRRGKGQGRASYASGHGCLAGLYRATSGAVAAC